MKVALSRPAQIQLGVILDYLQERNPRAAGTLAARVQRALREIASNPRLGRLQDVEGVRKKVVFPGGYLLFFSVDDEKQVATVLAVVHPKQDRPYRDG